MSVDATIHERVCSHRAVLLDDQPIGVNSHPATLRLPGNTTLATPRSVVVTYDFGSLEHAVAARPAAVTAAHTPKSAPRVAIDPYRLIDQRDISVGANALVDGGVVQKDGLGRGAKTRSFVCVAACTGWLLTPIG